MKIGVDIIGQDTFMVPPSGWDDGTVVTEITWDEQYGRIAEYGPRVKSWVIEAKYAKALRFPILTASGAVDKIQYVARGHHILFRWRESMLRPHVNPAIDELWPEIQETLNEIPNRALDGEGRAVELTMRWMDIFGWRIVDRAADILDRITRGGKSMLALGLASDTRIE